LIYKKPYVKVAKEISDIPILVLDCDDEFEAVPEKKIEMVSKIKQFLLSL
jgi:hypothetical protein